MADLIDKAAAVKIALDMAVGIEKDEAEALGWGGPDPRGYHARGIMLDQAKAFRRLAAAIASLPAQGVRLKPLVWEHTSDRTLDAVAIGPYYRIEVGVAGAVHWRTGYRGGWHEAISLDAAKAAAQADYESRILAALDAPAPVDALVKAVEVAIGVMERVDGEND